MIKWRHSLLAAAITISGLVSAADSISREQALSTAQTTARTMAFKDAGFEAGKLHKSWKYLAADNFSVVEAGEQGVVIKARNTEFDRVLYFSIATNGEVIAVSATNPVTVQ